ncbi:GntR family transcriptional regulator [Nonomuraea sp. NPDC048892]|uniref:GntR family transcriptional regulator n=1 Tax=Nonomuraea sp. NPDC048892 TaxID=3154624 RepID=UPI0033CDA6CD
MTQRTPDYVRIADRIGAKIRSGDMQPGDLVPSHAQLAREHNVSDNTARAALARLRSQGLIITKQGKGSLVADTPSPIISERDGRDIRPDAEGEDRALSAHVSQISAPTDIAEQLGLSAGDRVTQILYRWTVNGDVIEMSEYYEPLFPGTPTVQPAPGETSTQPDTISRFSRVGIGVTDVDEMTSARMPTPEEEHLMGIPPGTPVLTVRRIHYADTKPVAVTHSVFRADLFILHTRQRLSPS